MPGLINSGILYPLTQIAFDNSQSGVTTPSQPTLLIGQTITAQPTSVVPVFSVAQANALFGRGSILADMFARYFALDQLGPIYCLPLPDPIGGAAATGTLIFAGPATANGTISLYVAGHVVPVGVSAGDNATGICANAVAAINANPDLPVTAMVATGSALHATLTAKNLGTLGNAIDLRINYFGLASGEQLPAGVTVGVTQMAGGTGAALLSGVAAILADQSYRVIVHPYSTANQMQTMAALMSFSGGRWDPTRKSWGHCFTAHTDLAANLISYGPTNDDPHSTCFVYETGSPTSPWAAAAILAGAAAPSLRAQPNLPLQTLQLVGMMAPNASGAAGTETAWNKTVWQSLLGVGLAVASYNTAGQAFILRAPTTYQVNGYGQPDASYFDTEDMFLLMAQSDYLQSVITQKWGRVLVADSGTVVGPGIPLITPKSAMADILVAYLQMQALGWVEDVDAFIAATSVVRDTVNPSQLDVLFAPYQIVGLRQVGITNQFRKFSAAVVATALQAA